MLKKISFLLLIFLASFGLKAQQLTLDDVVIKRTYGQKAVYWLASLNDGLNYTTLENMGKVLVKYSYKTGAKVATLLDISVLKNDSLKAVSDYQFSSDESKVLLMTDRKPIYRRSFTANYFIYNSILLNYNKHYIFIIYNEI